MKNNYLIYLCLGLFIYISPFNAQVWSTLGSGLNDRSNTLYPYNGDLYAVGLFTLAGGNASNYIAKWNGTAWSTLGSGVDDRINGITSFSNTIYVAGDFQNAGGSPAPRIAKWDGTSWSSVGVNSGISGPAHALCVFQNELFVAGSTSGGGASTLSKWNGSIWSTVATFDNRVNCMIEYNGELYIGGQFTTVGVMPASKIIRYSGVSFTTLGGSGLNNNVGAFAIHNTELYIGGSFTALSNTATLLSNIAKWNGLAWSTVGSGCADWVLGLESYNGKLYACGTFTQAGGNSASHIASWNGTAWGSAGSGLNDNAFCMGKYNSKLVVAGTFTQAGGTPASKIAYFEDVVDGIKNQETLQNNFAIYPVPADDKIFVSQVTLNDNYDLNIYDLTGQQLITAKDLSGVQEVNLSSFHKGVFILEIKQSTGVWRTKIVRE